MASLEAKPGLHSKFRWGEQRRKLIQSELDAKKPWLGISWLDHNLASRCFRIATTNLQTAPADMLVLWPLSTYDCRGVYSRM